MEADSYIGHLNVAVNLDMMELKSKATIGRSNWITGYSTKTDSKHFKHQENRQSKLYVGENAAITKNHHLDCTNRIHIGAFSTVAGYSSQFLTHSIDVYGNKQHSTPIHIGNYTFISTNVVVLGGAVLPNYSVLGAKALLNKKFDDEWVLYGGVPAKPVKNIDTSAQYFSRTEGFVY
ncbi:acyltransferase [Mariniflexile sp.]|uniref:acyltransferase n=1 Tax=Mariniflexile sp. TaxID=1979402 RepID=UPI003566699F